MWKAAVVGDKGMLWQGNDSSIYSALGRISSVTTACDQLCWWGHPWMAPLRMSQPKWQPQHKMRIKGKMQRCTPFSIKAQRWEGEREDGDALTSPSFISMGGSCRNWLYSLLEVDGIKKRERLHSFTKQCQ